MAFPNPRSVSNFSGGFVQKHRQLYFYKKPSTKNSEQTWISEWGHKILFSHGTSASAGVCILFNNNFQCDIKKVYRDNSGRFIIVDIIIENQKITLANVYAPNTDDPVFFNQLFQSLEQFEGDYFIIGGDLNCVLDLKMNKQGGNYTTHFKCQQKILEAMENLNLEDIWRQSHLGERRFTWRRKNPLIQCRLDFF